MSFDLLLKNIRLGWVTRIKAKGLTIKEFCEQYDVNYSTFNNLRNPTIKLLDKIEREVLKLEGK